MLYTMPGFFKDIDIGSAEEWGGISGVYHPPPSLPLLRSKNTNIFW
jgi:hypothetical protein